MYMIRGGRHFQIRGHTSGIFQRFLYPKGGTMTPYHISGVKEPSPPNPFYVLMEQPLYEERNAGKARHRKQSVYHYGNILIL